MPLLGKNTDPEFSTEKHNKKETMQTRTDDLQLTENSYPKNKIIP